MAKVRARSNLGPVWLRQLGHELSEAHHETLDIPVNEVFAFYHDIEKNYLSKQGPEQIDP